jgi:hypothetical protein
MVGAVHENPFNQYLGIASHVCYSIYAGAVPGWPGQKMSTRPHLNRKKLSVVAHACHPSNGGKPKIGG